MGIDWFTFAAQIVNFLVLIGLLWHFAYKPIIRAMDEREDSIRQRLDEADQQRAEADEKARELDRQRDELEAQREDLLTQARNEAEEKRKALLDEARQRVQQSEAEWRDSLTRRKAELADSLRRRTGRHVVNATRQFVRDMADDALEKHVVDVFERRLDDLDKDTSRALQQAIRAADGQVTIASAFALGDDLQRQLRDRVAALVNGDTRPDFDTDPDLICGVELRAGDRHLAWSAREYLADLQDQIEAAITSASQSAGEQAHDHTPDSEQQSRTDDNNDDNEQKSDE